MTISNDVLKNKIMGHGFIEEFSIIDSWRVRGFFSIGAYTHLSTGSNIWNAIIGRFSRIDANVSIGFRMAEHSIFSNHYFAYAEEGGQKNNPEYNKIKSKRFHFDKQSLCFIGNDVRIHQGTIICSGVAIGDGAIIYPNSVVIDNVPAYSIVAGNPAKIIGYRFSKKTISKIVKSNWTDCDLSLLEMDTSFADVADVLSQFALSPPPPKTYNCCYVNSFLNKIDSSPSKKLIIGPSHINIWQDKINSGQRKSPHFQMFGVHGMSLYQSKLKLLIDWFINKRQGDVVLFVPDFRIGNSALCNEDISLDPLFIYSKSINKENDMFLYNNAIDVLDSLVACYKERIKFIFWCLIGREKTNKIKNKYTINDEYRHPIWNYDDIKKRYSENILYLPDIEEKISELIIPGGTIHPNEKGYDFLEEIISTL